MFAITSPPSSLSFYQILFEKSRIKNILWENLILGDFHEP